MIQPGIKFYLILFAFRFYPDTTQIFFPSPGRLGFSLIKRELLGLYLQVMPGVLHRSIRQSYLCRYRGIFLEIIAQINTCPYALDLTGTGLLLILKESSKRIRLVIYNRREIKRNGSSRLVFLDIFRFGDYPTFNTPLLCITNISIFHGSALPLPVPDIKQNMVGLAFRERETLESHTRRSGKFRTNLIIIQHNRVIPRSGYLIFPDKRRAIPPLHAIGR